MSTSYPASLDSFTNPAATDTLDSSTVPHDQQHSNANDAIEALQAKVGVNNSTVASSLDYRVGQLESKLTSLMIVEDQKPSGASAGSSVAGINTRTLNTVVYNGITGASLASNQVTLPAGTYLIEASAPQERSQNSQLLLRNVTDNTYETVGTYNHSSTSAAYASVESTISDVITIASSKTFQLDHWISNAQATYGLGASVGTASGNAVVYARMKITKIG